MASPSEQGEQSKSKPSLHELLSSSRPTTQPEAEKFDRMVNALAELRQFKSNPSAQILLSSRPPVTQHEADTIDKIAEALTKSETFYLSGTLDLATLGVNNPTVFYAVNDENGDAQAARAISLPKPLADALDLLHADADPSPFGHNKELVLDESYRLARELRSDRLSLNFDPTAVNAGVLAAVSAFAAPHLDSSDASHRYREPELVHRKTGLQATLYKLNSYTTGGHFKRHQDTPKADNHIGTLLFGLPTSFSGGELILANLSKDSQPEAGDVKIDWSESSKSPLSLPWVFFYSDVEHEILPVSSGRRLTIAYDIFAADTVRYRVPGDPEKIDTRSMELFNVLNDALKDEQFLNNGGKLAFALTYQYPAKEMELAKTVAFDAILKGNDYLLFHTLEALSLTPKIRAVYQPEEFSESYKNERLLQLLFSGKTRYPADRFSSFRTPMSQTPGDYGESREDIAYFTAETFMGIDSSRCQSDEESRIQLLKDSTKASVDWHLIWVKRPTVAAWTKASTFAYYGNEPGTTYTYVAGVLVVSVPRVGKGARKKPE